MDEVCRDVAASLLAAQGDAVAYIGAGASASSGVPTFHGEGAAGSLLSVREDSLKLPTYAHRAVVLLMERGLVRFCTSSNHDGLIAGPRVSEVFGSAFQEVCLQCKARFTRSTVTPSLNRKCETCGGKLKKSGCRYGQEIYRPPLEAAERNAIARVALVLGSGMHTWPLSRDGFPGLADRVFSVAKSGDVSEGKFVHSNSDCDAFMRGVMAALELEVPAFVFEAPLRVGWDADGTVSVRASHPMDAVTCLAAVEVDGADVERGMRWTYEHPVPVAPGAHVRVSLQPVFAGAPPIVVELSEGATRDVVVRHVRQWAE